MHESAWADRVVGHLAEMLAIVLADEQLKAVSDVVRSYADDLTAAVLDVLDGNLTRGEAGWLHRTMLAQDAKPAFIEGLRDGGVDEPELSDEDDESITAWIAEQREHVAEFWMAVADVAKRRPQMSRDEYDAARRNLFARVTLWESALRELAGQGKASALANMMVTWRLGATEEHCSTCQWLNGKRHRLRWFTDQDYIPQQNGSETLECGGWRCECRLLDAKGKQVLPA